MKHTFTDASIPEEVLEHIGIPRRSGRYAWGSGENPYHHGADSPFGKLKQRREDKKRKAAEKKRAEERKASLAKAREARAAKRVERQNAEEYEKKKQWAIEKGTATDIAPFVKDMSKAEFVKARERLEEQEKFMKLVVKESPAGQRRAKMEQLKNNVDSVTQYTNSLIGAYNTFSRVHNAFGEKEWPIIPSSGKTLGQLKGNNNNQKKSKNKTAEEVVKDFENAASGGKKSKKKKKGNKQN